jgi:molecular chaperone GrpE
MLRIVTKVKAPLRSVVRSVRGFSSNEPNSTSQTQTATAEPVAAVAEEDVVAKLMKENQELKDKLLRSYAEEENVRRIAKRDVENSRQYANVSFAKALLDVADNLERAMNAVPPESHASTDPLIKNLLMGVKMTNTDLMKAFEKFGVQKYGAVGDKFDPALHEALFQIPDATKDSNTVGQLLKVGYKMKDRIIRAAEVGTYIAPPTSTPTESS